MVLISLLSMLQGSFTEAEKGSSARGNFEWRVHEQGRKKAAPHKDIATQVILKSLHGLRLTGGTLVFLDFLLHITEVGGSGN